MTASFTKLDLSELSASLLRFSASLDFSLSSPK
jgi:hypothetical protein